MDPVSPHRQLPSVIITKRKLSQKCDSSPMNAALADASGAQNVGAEPSNTDALALFGVQTYYRSVRPFVIPWRTIPTHFQAVLFSLFAFILTRHTDTGLSGNCMLCIDLHSTYRNCLDRVNKVVIGSNSTGVAKAAVIIRSLSVICAINGWQSRRRIGLLTLRNQSGALPSPPPASQDRMNHTSCHAWRQHHL
ncbi:hypothetical protein BKA82DRAFT_2885891 [Pisolithus tinctorius]|nr:hypothetical protein BKA82DRAFT_2885891 [Pisolithus tinctorius]